MGFNLPLRTTMMDQSTTKRRMNGRAQSLLSHRSHATTVCILIFQLLQGIFIGGGMASLFVEVLPGVEINRLADISLKVTNSKPGEMIVERRYGMMEIHSFEREEVLHAGQMILEELGLKEEDRWHPASCRTSIINKIDPYQAVIINRNSKGMLIWAATMYICWRLRRRLTLQLPPTKPKNTAMSGWSTYGFSELPAAFIWPAASQKSRRPPKK